MKIAIELTPDEATLLRKRAKSLGVLPEELARSVVTDALSAKGDQFAEIAEDVLRDHAQLYERLA